MYINTLVFYWYFRFLLKFMGFTDIWVLYWDTSCLLRFQFPAETLIFCWYFSFFYETLVFRWMFIFMPLPQYFWYGSVLWTFYWDFSFIFKAVSYSFLNFLLEPPVFCCCMYKFSVKHQLSLETFFILILHVSVEILVFYWDVIFSFTLYVDVGMGT